MQEFFRKFARTTAEIVGSPWAFVTGVLLVVIWLVSGPLFHFSDTWQITINTVTTIVTFLMVFVIQNSQNRDAKAIHLKLDELLRAVESARTDMVDLEHRPDAELEELQSEFLEMRNDNAERVGDRLDDLHQDVREHLEEHADDDNETQGEPQQAQDRRNSH
jgi:low affinity Fe/Cu permease